MEWLNKVVDEAIKRQPEGEIIIESGSSPSGSYHLGHLRELITCDAILVELKKRGRQAKHIAYVDDLDALRKIPVNVPTDYSKHLGKSLCNIPAPDGSEKSYAEYFLKGLKESAAALGFDVEFIYSHEQYRAGFFVPAIEAALEQGEKVRKVLETVSGHKLGDEWSPIQINEDGYLKKRRFLDIDKQAKTVKYEDLRGHEQTIRYNAGDVKLDWRIDWPARWHLLKVAVEPSGRDHATKGGSMDTGMEIQRQVFGSNPPIQVGYDFVNLAGDTKKMSASKGTGLDAAGVVKVLPPEIVRFFMIQYPPSKRLYFDPENGVAKLIDDFAALLDKKGATESDKRLIELASSGIEPTICNIPFSLLVESYQAALKDPDKTLEALDRTEYKETAAVQAKAIKEELKFIDRWLKTWAPDEVKFELSKTVDPAKFNESEKNYLSRLADSIAKLPAEADGETLHKVIYAFKETDGFTPQQLFGPLYGALIGKTSGPRAGWFLAMLPRDWLLKRLRLEA